MLKCWFAALKTKEQGKDTTGQKELTSQKSGEEWSWWSRRPLSGLQSGPLACPILKYTTSETREIWTNCVPYQQIAEWISEEMLYRQKNRMSSEDASELAIQRNKGCIAEVIGDPDIDHLKLQCILDENMKQEGDGQRQLVSRRPVGEARLSSPIEPKR